MEENKIIEDAQDAEIMKSFETNEPKEAEIVELKPIEPEIKLAAKMDFFEALQQAMLGEKIHKLEWNNLGFYGVMDKDLLVLHKPDGNNYQWTISKADMEGLDYVLIK